CQRYGRKLPEHRLVFACELAELPETVARGDFGHGGGSRIALAEVPPRKLHAAHQKEMLGAGPQLLLATDPQRPLGHSDGFADFWNVKRLSGAFPHIPMKAPH